MQLSLMLGKNIVERDQLVGKIDGICWQKGQHCLLQIEDKIWSADKIKIKGDVVSTTLKESSSRPTLSLGKQIYDTDGKLMGLLQDVELTATLKVKNLTLDNGATVTLSKIVANNDIITVRADKPKKTKQQIAVAEDKTKPQPKIAPKRKSGDFSFLVGKIVDKNIFNFLGELMIREGDVVTREVYLKARAFGKLTELCLHTK